ncbi:hypothetical protein ACVGW3_00325, partial [Enterobacter hormaechei]
AAAVAPHLHPLRCHHKKNTPPDNVVFSHQIHPQNDKPPLFTVVINQQAVFAVDKKKNTQPPQKKNCITRWWPFE